MARSWPSVAKDTLRVILVLVLVNVAVRELQFHYKHGIPSEMPYKQLTDKDRQITELEQQLQSQKAMHDQELHHEQQQLQRTIGSCRSGEHYQEEHYQELQQQLQEVQEQLQNQATHHQELQEQFQNQEATHHRELQEQLRNQEARHRRELQEQLQSQKATHDKELQQQYQNQKATHGKELQQQLQSIKVAHDQEQYSILNQELAEKDALVTDAEQQAAQLKQQVQSLQQQLAEQKGTSASPTALGKDDQKEDHPSNTMHLLTVGIIAGTAWLLFRFRRVWWMVARRALHWVAFVGVPWAWQMFAGTGALQDRQEPQQASRAQPPRLPTGGEKLSRATGSAARHRAANAAAAAAAACCCGAGRGCRCGDVRPVDRCRSCGALTQLCLGGWCAGIYVP